MFTTEELQVILASLNAATIKGSDARFVAQLQEKILASLTPIPEGLTQVTPAKK